ncbi:protein phosphatase 2C 70, partial [Tanacetum coccineum]
NPKVDKKGLGYGFVTKACFVCGSFSHLIRDYDFHEKRMAKQAKLNNRIGKGSSQREIRPVWNNMQRVNHQNQFVPKAVLTRTGKIQVNTTRTSGTNTVNTARTSGTNNVSTPRHNFNTHAVPTNAAMKVNTVKPIVNRVNTAEVNAVSAVGRKRETAVKPSAASLNGDEKDQTVLGKDYSNLLIADSLLKTIWFINAPCYGNEALASPKANVQTATGKDTSNSLMAGSLPKTNAMENIDEDDDQQELALMCGRIFPEESDQVEKYVGGLPDMIQGSVMASKPKTMQEAIEIANDLMDQKVCTFAEKQAENKRRLDNNSSDNNAQQPPFKRQNVARACSVGPSEKKEYAGTLPLCNKCKLRHNGPCTVKCANCNKVGHLTRDCRSPATTTNNQRTLICYECENQGHYSSDCPKIKNRNHGNQTRGTKARGMVYALGGGETGQDPNNMEYNIDA